MTSTFKIIYYSYLQKYHVIIIHVDFNEHCIIPYVVQRLERIQRDELLRSEASVAVPDGPAEERLVLLAGIRLDGVGNITPCRRVLALVYHGEGDPMGEGERKEGVELTLADAGEDGHEMTLGCFLFEEQDTEVGNK